MEMDKPHDRRKKRYEKPRLARFPLRPDEAVLGFCKGTTVGSPGSGCSNALGPCKIHGS